MKTKLNLTYIFPVLILLMFSFKSVFSQVEVDTSREGPPDETPTLDNFKDSLSSKGEWIKIDKSQIDPDSEYTDGDQVDTEYVDEDVCTDYVWVPNPTIIWVGWNPYCYGHWVWTWWGWQWYPYYDWGWCTYHYGRWWYSNHYGWCWSPGWRWRSHWVSWYHNGPYWGWHPVTPRVRIHDGVSVIALNKGARDDGWVFVNKKDFKKPIDGTKIVDPSKHTEIFNSGSRNKNDGTRINTKETGRKNDNGYVNGTKQEKSGVSSTNEGHRKVIIYRKHDGSNNSGSKGSYNNSGSKGSYNNSGSRGSNNSGSRNQGSYNSGSRSHNNNSGSKSSGTHNSGSHNSGNHNSGSHNSGSHNNSGSRSK